MSVEGLGDKIIYQICVIVDDVEKYVKQWLFRKFGAMRENRDHRHHVRKRHMTVYRSDALKKHNSLRFARL